MTAREIRQLTGLSQDAFSKKYDIPKRTIENWESGNRKAPEYVMQLLERVVKEDFKGGKSMKIEKKWCIIHDMSTRRAVESIEAYADKEEALREAEHEWNCLMTEGDKKDTDRYIVGLCNVEEYAPNCWQYAEIEGNIDADIYEIAKVYK